jgi:hypothetical protein
MKSPSDPIAIAHRVLPHENFERTTQILLKLLHDSQRQHPGKKRHLCLEIEGHRTSNGGFDHDMFELQSKFMLEFLIQFLTRTQMPLGTFQNPNSQNNEIPERLDLIAIDPPSPSPGSGEFKAKPRF